MTLTLLRLLHELSDSVKDAWELGQLLIVAVKHSLLQLQVDGSNEAKQMLQLLPDIGNKALVVGNNWLMLVTNHRLLGTAV